LTQYQTFPGLWECQKKAIQY